MTLVILGETLSYLRINGIWPKSGHELNPGKWFYIKFILLLTSQSVILIGSSAHLVVSVQSKSPSTATPKNTLFLDDSSNIFLDLVILIGEVGVFYFNATYVRYEEPIAKIFTHLSNFNKFGKPPNFAQRNKKLMFWSRLYKTYIDAALVSIYLEPFIKLKSCERENLKRKFKEICGLVVATWAPFDISVFPFKQILYVWQVYTLMFTLKGAALISFSIMESMEHLVVRIQHLKTMLLETVETEDAKLRVERLLKCVEYHNDIFGVGQEMDKNFANCLFLHVLFSGALFGCIGYIVMETFSLLSYSLFLGWVLSLIIVSVSGQHVMDEGLSVGDTAYNSKWYDRNASFQRNIVLIIIRSQRPILIHAGPFSYLSHVIVLTIFKTAYTYMTMLNATSK
ncbi:hypothetical protein Zmor_024941 [Zophobas morio]|uniref:Odorant receptor n=1 Tax=Zophobas morio TaxID=2755281 RepID=A0AA38HSV4_9CUCU|nr:hypothetical protein Zmor_024941 [Zophobas morio]